MRARISSFYLPLALLSVVVSATEGVTEFRCSSEISYTWAKKPPAPPPPARADGAPGGRAAAPSPALSPTQVPLAPTPEPTVVRLLGVERGGRDEAAARAALRVETDRQRIRASEACKRDHESFGTCVALKMSAQASVLNSLSFSGRSELEKALTEECRHQEGSCTGVEVAEPKCAEVVAAQPAASPGPDKPSDTKGSKEPAKDGKKK